MKFENMLNTITLGDSYKLIKDIPDKSIDLIITDPPYEIITTGAGILKDRKTRFLDNIQGKLDRGINEEILDEFCRVMKRINIYIWCSKAQIKKYLDYFLAKTNLYEILIWHKTNPVPTINGTYLCDKEYCLFFRDKGVELKGTVENKRTVWTTKCNVEDKKKYKHPTIKPLSIIKTLIENSSNKGDIVLDCFSGSGTTCVAAKELERQFLGIEIDPEYHKISLDRLHGILADGQISFDTLAERTKDEI